MQSAECGVQVTDLQQHLTLLAGVNTWTYYHCGVAACSQCIVHTMRDYAEVCKTELQILLPFHRVCCLSITLTCHHDQPHPSTTPTMEVFRRLTLSALESVGLAECPEGYTIISAGELHFEPMPGSRPYGVSGQSGSPACGAVDQHLR